jgi:preprotein translocase subunit SecG
MNDSILLALFMTVALLLYVLLKHLSREGRRQRFGLSDESPLYITKSLRRLVHRSTLVVLGIKYLLLVLLLLPVFMSHGDIRTLSLFPLAILVVSVGLFLFRATWNKSIVQAWIYLPALFLVLVVENFGRDNLMFGIPLHIVSHMIFVPLLILVVIKVFVRNRASHLFVSPLEYLIMLIVLTVTLLPQSVTEQYHLLIVAAKSIVMFVAFKLVLMRQIQRNRKIILAIALSALILVLRGVLVF